MLFHLLSHSHCHLIKSPSGYRQEDYRLSALSICAERDQISSWKSELDNRFDFLDTVSNSEPCGMVAVFGLTIITGGPDKNAFA